MDMALPRRWRPDNLFSLRGELPFKMKTLFGVYGIIQFIFIWWAYVGFSDILPSVLPTPWSVITCIPEMVQKFHLFSNLAKSVLVNVLGYLEAIAISLVLGFFIGLFPVCRAVFERPISALRFLPLTAVLGPMTKWFGIEINMNIQFLTLGVVVYMLPTVIQRIQEVPQVYVDTLKTLGATKWQTIREVFWPDVISRFSDDLRVLSGITWTYIVIAEMTNSSEGGIGAMIFTVQKQQRMDMVFAIVLIILVIAILWDQLLRFADYLCFKFKRN